MWCKSKERPRLMHIGWTNFMKSHACFCVKVVDIEVCCYNIEMCSSWIIRCIFLIMIFFSLIEKEGNVRHLLVFIYQLKFRLREYITMKNTHKTSLFMYELTYLCRYWTQVDCPLTKSKSLLMTFVFLLVLVYSGTVNFISCGYDFVFPVILGFA